MENRLNVIMQTSFSSTSVVVSRGLSKAALQRARKIGLTTTAGVLFFAALAGCSRTPNPDVIATVNGHPITKSEVDKYYKAQVNSMQQPPTADESATLKLDILKQRVGEEVIRQQAEKLHLVATDAEVDAKIAQLKAPYTEQQFNEQLKAKGLTLADVDGANFYNLHKADFNLIEPQYHLAQIVVTPNPSGRVENRQNSKARNDEEARKKINALHNQLETG